MAYFPCFKADFIFLLYKTGEWKTVVFESARTGSIETPTQTEYVLFWTASVNYCIVANFFLCFLTNLLITDNIIN